jgi:NADH dehydrogenase
MADVKERRVIIVGGGFGGAATALALEKKNIPGLKIVLVSNKPHFEYYPALYRVVTGRSPLEVCIPLREIFKGKDVEVLEDTIINVNLSEKTLEGKSDSRYMFDFLVLALGSETAYFNIPGLEELSFSFKSINDGLRLKRHLHESFSAAEKMPEEERIQAAHIVVVGGGASGTELAGELALYTRRMAKYHKINPSLVTIDLIEAAPRLVPSLPEEVSAKIYNRLHDLGVNIFLGRTVVKEEVEEIFMKDMEIKTKTVVWTAGIRPNRFYTKISGLEFDKKERVLVDEFLQAEGVSNVFVIGDAAATPYTGMAQTASYDGRLVAQNIGLKIKGRSMEKYQPKKPYHSVPIGPGWAATIIGPVIVYGRIGWFFRRLADFRYFFSILSLRKTISAFRNGRTICEACSICTQEDLPPLKK